MVLLAVLKAPDGNLVAIERGRQVEAPHDTTRCKSVAWFSARSQYDHRCRTRRDRPIAASRSRITLRGSIPQSGHWNNSASGKACGSGPRLSHLPLEPASRSRSQSGVVFGQRLAASVSIARVLGVKQKVDQSMISGPVRFALAFSRQLDRSLWARRTAPMVNKLGNLHSGCFTCRNEAQMQNVMRCPLRPTSTGGVPQVNPRPRQHHPQLPRPHPWRRH
jgi:hypothetical protein